MAVYKDTERGTWYTSFHYKDWTGKDRRKMKRGFSTKKAALDWEASFLRTKASSMDMTFGEFFTVYEEDVRSKLKENTWLTKEHIVQKKLLPYFQNVKMVDVTVRDIIKWQNEMRAAVDENGKQYSPTYLKTVQAQLSCIFNHAVRFYELPSNPIHQAGPLGAEESEEMLFWTKEEYLQFISTMANKPYSYYAFELLYWCGIRMGELRALTPADFDFENNTLSITKSYQRIKGEDVITKPKTKKSTNSIVYRINRMQIRKRSSGLDKEDKKELMEIKRESGNNLAAVCCCILLESFDEAEMYFDDLSAEEKDSFEMFPINNLWRR